MDIHSQLDDPFVSSDLLYYNLISSINSNGLTTFDLLTYAHSSNRGTTSSILAKRLGRSIREIDTFLDILKEKANNTIESNPIPVRETGDENNDGGGDNQESEPYLAPTGLFSLDKHLGGGIPIGEITEVFGSSGSGKSQFLFHLSMHWQTIKEIRKHKCECIFISTESPLQTGRLEGIAKSIPGTSLEKITYIYCPDLESQDHIMQTQLPVLLKNSERNYGLIIVDSISHHLRREDAISNVSYLRTSIAQQEEKLTSLSGYAGIKKNIDTQYDSFFKSTANYRNFAARSRYSIELYSQLQKIAKDYNLAIVIANQVSDSFDSDKRKGVSISDFDDNHLNYDVQVAFISGWDRKTVQKHIQKLDVSPMANELYTDLMKSFDSSRNTRRKLNETELDPRNKSASRNLTEMQTSLVNDLHQETGGSTKKYVAALGYHWSRRITTRILCMKTYRPSLQAPARVDTETGMTYEQLCAGFEVPADDDPVPTKKRSDQIFNNYQPQSLAELVDSWKVERFFRVIASSHSSSKKNHHIDNIPFSVNSCGIREGN
ncbi:hypothetical protein CLIB1423_02S09626 [[Candida] railenensis]|uniref:RecA family profile 1 domain-containing protein n=1 Tax=[Candida] railenensis TaxID=45579 RepID=A0A9P0QLQ2_9ASCO|nr:hypothetical protein CLIB1423_02S09626 [[Candida] railenensis]